MPAFSVATVRKHVLAPYGASRLLEKSLDDVRDTASIASTASTCIYEAVRAALCDLDDEATALMSRAREWLGIAIEESEPVRIPNYDEARRHLQLALASWLLTDSFEKEHAGIGCDYLTGYIATQNDKTEIAHCLPAFVIAERYHEVVDHFNNCQKLKRPSSLRNIKCPGKISLLLAEHFLTGEPGRESIAKAYREFLKYQLPVCVGVRSQGLGTPHDVPLWIYIDLVSFDPAQPGGIPSLRRVFDYVAKEKS